MARSNWTRDETLVAFDLYCRTPFGRLHARNPEIVEVAGALGRTPGALAMKCCNLAAFDTALQIRGISGLRKASRIDEQIWEEFHRDPETVAFEAEQAYSAVMHHELRLADTVEWEDVQGLDRAALTKVRVNQSFFRSMVLAGYRSKCAVCDLPFDSLLVAAHIVPWSIDRSLRMNPRNGICLCSLHDRAYDQGLLHFACDCTISLHSDVEAVAHIPSVNVGFIQFAGKSLTLPDRWHPDPVFLDRHRELLRPTLATRSGVGVQ